MTRLRMILARFRDETGALTIGHLPGWAVAAIRTAIQYVLSSLFAVDRIADLLTWLESIGFAIDPARTEAAAEVIALTLVVALFNFVARRFPSVGVWINRLLSLFTSGGSVVYDHPEHNDRTVALSV